MRHRTARQKVDDLNSAFSYDASRSYSKISYIGNMDKDCVNCNAYKFKGERPSLCCLNGKINISTLQKPPNEIFNLLTTEDRRAKHFQENIRLYNSAYSMTSFGANIVRTQGFNPTFTIQRQVYHRIGSLLPLNTEPQFLQIYFVDHKEQIRLRKKHLPSLNEDTLQQIQAQLNKHNPYVRDFKRKVKNSKESFKLVISEKHPNSMHKGRFNKPQTDEVAVIMSDKVIGKRDIIVEKRSEGLMRISELHRSYDPLQYPLLHL